MTVTVTRRLTLDAVLKMATAEAQKHADAVPADRKANSELSQAIDATWALIRGRLGSAEAAALDGLIAKVVGKPSIAKQASLEK
jgi:hypothetical protein